MARTPTNNELRSSIDSYETAAAWSAGAVILGVIIETALAIYHPPYDASATIWGGAVADMLVALGVAGEVLFSRMGSKRQRELQRRADITIAESTTRAADANRQAAEARTEMEKVRVHAAPRVLTDSQKKVLEALKGKLLAVNVVCHSDAESASFSSQIIRALMDAGVAVQVYPPRTGFHWSGVIVVSPGLIAETKDDPLSNAVFDAGLWGGNMQRDPTVTLLADLPLNVPVLMVGTKHLRFVHPTSYS